MTKPATSDLTGVIPPGASLLVDTSVVLAYLTGTERHSPAAAQLFDGFVATGRNRASLAMVTVGELLVRPFQRGAGAVAIVDGFLRHFDNLDLVPVSYDVAREAAGVRASVGLAMPDALIVASAVAAGVDLLVTSDRAWESVGPVLGPDVGLVILGG